MNIDMNIEKLLDQGLISEALDILEKSNDRAVLIRARYNALKKDYNMGLQDFDDYQRGLRQIEFAISQISRQVIPIIVGKGKLKSNSFEIKTYYTFVKILHGKTFDSIETGRFQIVKKKDAEGIHTSDEEYGDQYYTKDQIKNWDSL